MLKHALIAAAGATILTTTIVEARDHREGRDPTAIFEEFDANGDGDVTREEVDAHRAARFTDLDTDGNGEISEAEYVAAAAARAEERAKTSFARLDADGDGALSRDVLEMRRGGKRMDRIFSRLDADGDDIVTTEEFEAGMERFAQFRKHHGGRRNR